MDVKTSPTQQCFFCRFISSFSSYPLRLQQVLLLSQSQSQSHIAPPAQSWPGWDGQHAQIHPRHCCRPLLEDPEHMVHLDLELRLRCSFFFNISSKLKGTDSGVHSRNIHTNVTTALLKLTKSKRKFPISLLSKSHQVERAADQDSRLDSLTLRENFQTVHRLLSPVPPLGLAFPSSRQVHAGLLSGNA